jgi:diaminopimelate epimerase
MKNPQALEFLKMSGAGNDFIVVDNLDSSLDSILTGAFISTLCRRGMQVGADGLLELRKDPDLPFRMKYYNSDGGEAEMCGNGARCISQFAAMKGIVARGEEFRFRSSAGIHRARVNTRDSARIWLTEPEIHFFGRSMLLGSRSMEVSFVNTGVPHAVMITGTGDDPPFLEIAPLLRSHPIFGSEGTNADYIWEEDGEYRMRTWERGVEGETLACGTGAVACAICAVELLDGKLPLDIRTRGNRILSVGMDAHGWWLEGEARPVYEGTLIEWN